MLFSFVKYFSHYIFFSKTRQKLLFLVIIGLMLSSCALLVLQSVMGGLQNGLISRSQNVEGIATVILKYKDKDFAERVFKTITESGFISFPEYEIELLVSFGQNLSPAIVHGIDYSLGIPPFLKNIHVEKNSTIVGIDLLRELRAEVSSPISLVSPSHIQALIGEIPRQVNTTINDLIITDIPEVDRFHIWTRLSLIHNLIRDHHINRIRIYSQSGAGISSLNNNIERLRHKLKSSFKNQVEIKTWEEQNSSLVWALNLETTVMVFLFVVMTLLITISISSGFIVFFDKIKKDLVSFWILGASEKKIKWGSILFINFISFITTFMGLGFGLIILFLLDRYGMDVMPDMFVDRSIPVLITTKGILTSFFIPYLIAVSFSYLTLKNIQKNRKDYLNIVRSVGS